VDFSTRERGIAQYTSAVHAIDRLRSVSARAAPLLFIGRRALPRSHRASMRRRQESRYGVDFSTVDAVGLRAVRSEGAGPAGVACWNSPSAVAAGPRASAPGGTEARGRASGGAGSEAIDRQVRGATKSGPVRRFLSGPLRLRLHGVPHERCKFRHAPFRLDKILFFTYTLCLIKERRSLARNYFVPQLGFCDDMSMHM